MALPPPTCLVANLRQNNVGALNVRVFDASGTMVTSHSFVFAGEAPSKGGVLFRLSLLACGANNIGFRVPTGSSLF